MVSLDPQQRMLRFASARQHMLLSAPQAKFLGSAAASCTAFRSKLCQLIREQLHVRLLWIYKGYSCRWISSYDVLSLHMGEAECSMHMMLDMHLMAVLTPEAAVSSSDGYD